MVCGSHFSPNQGIGGRSFPATNFLDRKRELFSNAGPGGGGGAGIYSGGANSLVGRTTRL